MGGRMKANRGLLKTLNFAYTFAALCELLSRRDFAAFEEYRGITLAFGD